MRFMGQVFLSCLFLQPLVGGELGAGGCKGWRKEAGRAGLEETSDPRWVSLERAVTWSVFIRVQPGGPGVFATAASKERCHLFLRQLSCECQTQICHQVQDGDTVGMEVLPWLQGRRLPRRSQGPREDSPPHTRSAEKQREESHR